MIRLKNKKRKRKTSSLSTLCISAVSTATAMYPIDIARALKMSSVGRGSRVISLKDFVRHHGVKGLFGQGVLPEIGRASMMRVSKFFFFPRLCSLLYGRSSTECTAPARALAGALCTVPEILLISPFEVAKIGLQLDSQNKYRNSTVAFLRHRLRTLGPNAGFYAGWAGMQYRQASWTAVFFTSLDFYRETCTQYGMSSTIGSFVGGFLAGSSGVLVNCPGDVVRTMVQRRGFENATRPAQGIGFRSIVEHLSVARELCALDGGVRNLYSGFGIKCFHLGLSGALMVFFVDFYSDLFIQRT